MLPINTIFFISEYSRKHHKTHIGINYIISFCRTTRNSLPRYELIRSLPVIKCAFTEISVAFGVVFPQQHNSIDVIACSRK